MLKLPYHGRYDYSAIAKRPVYDWPGGKRLAVCVALNIEHFAYASGIGHSLSAELPQPDVRTFAWRDYGNRVGIWRLLDALDEFSLPACHLMNTTVFDYAPDIAPAIMARGDEFVGHGRTNAERQGQMWEDDERRLIETVRDTIAQRTGKPPRGWMGPWMSSSAHTPDLLQESGFTYVMEWPTDDQPIWMRTRSGRIMLVPYSLEINDSPQILVRHHTPEQFRDFIIGQFEEMLRLSEKQPLVCAIELHTMIFGHPYRLRCLRQALKHIAEHPQRDRVWFARPGEVYDHCAALPAGIVPGS